VVLEGLPRSKATLENKKLIIFSHLVTLNFCAARVPSTLELMEFIFHWRREEEGRAKAYWISQGVN
jgi:hypothetical protein